ncbi:hypothetical protein B1690_02630 [Geobacillus sp. 46C-IIa]|nr:hypothetical protein B1690_02630 [Geobacillus sp. 46C-IIa]
MKQNGQAVAVSAPTTACCGVPAISGFSVGGVRRRFFFAAGDDFLPVDASESVFSFCMQAAGCFF